MDDIHKVPFTSSLHSLENLLFPYKCPCKYLSCKSQGYAILERLYCPRTHWQAAVNFTPDNRVESLLYPLINNLFMTQCI